MNKMGQATIVGPQELVDYSEGKIELKATNPSIRPVRETISADEIRAVRKALGMTQRIFALAMGVSRKTVESWETGRYMPDGAARRLISMFQSDPTILEKYGIIDR